MYEQFPIALESEAGFRVLFKCATISILVINQNGNIELSNPCAERLFGYEPAELIGNPIEVLIPESLRQQHTHHRETYFHKPRTRPMGVGMELYARKKNGDVFRSRSAWVIMNLTACGSQ
jgi:PAS domain S-box-containing protein